MAFGGWSGPYLCLCWLGSGNDKVVMVLLPLGSSLWCSYTVWVEGVREVRREPCGWHVLELQQVHSRLKGGCVRREGRVAVLWSQESRAKAEKAVCCSGLLISLTGSMCGRMRGREQQGRMRWTSGDVRTAYRYPATIVVLCVVGAYIHTPQCATACTAAPIARALRQCSSGRLGQSKCFRG